MVHSINEEQRIKYPITHICFTKLTKSESNPHFIPLGLGADIPMPKEEIGSAKVFFFLKKNNDLGYSSFVVLKAERQEYV
jgi:hypothetical protein